MRAMQTLLGMTLAVIGTVLVFLLVASATAAPIGLTIFLIRRSRVRGPSPVG